MSCGTRPGVQSATHRSMMMIGSSVRTGAGPTVTVYLHTIFSSFSLKECSVLAEVWHPAGTGPSKGQQVIGSGMSSSGKTSNFKLNDLPASPFHTQVTDFCSPRLVFDFIRRC